jgi:DNA-binding SARP family transcriptional activator
MERTVVQLCGRLIVEIGGERVEHRLPGRQGRLLFAYLALHRDRPVPRSELIDAVWSRELPRDPSEALAALLSKVRAALGGRYLEGRREPTLALPGLADVDVERAVRAVHEAESACALADWPRAWGPALTAMFVARRTFLGDYEARWIDEWRRTLDDVRLRSLECYARACLHIGGTELASAARAADELLRLAPLRETACELLVCTLEAQGNHAEALVVYGEMCRRLRDELGVAPGARLQAAYRRLLDATAG